MTTERRCPRCGRPLPPEAYYARLPTAPDRAPAYVVRHALRDEAGRKVGTCVAYAGAETARQAEWTERGLRLEAEEFLANMEAAARAQFAKGA